MKADSWFRVWTRILDNPKLQTMDPSLFRQLINFWSLSKLNNGTLPPVAEIAWRLRRTSAEVSADIEALLDKEYGLLERRGKSISPTRWEDWQTRKPVSTERVQRFRSKSRNDNETLNETPIETRVETLSETLGNANVTQKRNTEERRGEEKRIPPTPLPGGDAAQFELQLAPTRRFVKPTPEEVEAYALSITFPLSGQSFFDYYESKGWRVGQTPMKDWKAAVRTWKQRRTEAAGASVSGAPRRGPVDLGDTSDAN